MKTGQKNNQVCWLCGLLLSGLCGLVFMTGSAPRRIVAEGQPVSGQGKVDKKSDNALGKNAELDLLGAIGKDRLVDMSYTFDETTIYWPTDKPFRWEKNHWGAKEGGYWYASANYAASEHGGTHLDSPIHFAKDGATTDKIGLERLIGPAYVIDIRKLCEDNPEYQLSVADMKASEAKNGPIGAGTILVVRTGWGQRWPDKMRYLGTDKPGDVPNLHFPGISTEAAEYIASLKKVDGVAIDTPSLDFGQSKDFKTHIILNSAGIFGIENLANAEKLPEQGAVLIALPMKIGGGSGGPVRVMGVLPEE